MKKYCSSKFFIFLILLVSSFLQLFGQETPHLEVGDKNILLPSPEKKSVSIPYNEIFNLISDSPQKTIVYKINSSNQVATIYELSKTGSNNNRFTIDHKKNEVKIKSRMLAKIISPTLRAQQEQPILGQTETHWICMAILVETKNPLVVEIPKDLKGIVIHPMSKAMRIEQEMTKKGFIKYEGKWITAEQVREKEQKEQEIIKQKNALIRAHFATAMQGFIVLKNQKIIYGQSEGMVGNTLYFKIKDQPQASIFPLESLSDLPQDELFAIGYLEQALLYYADSKQALEKKDYNNAIQFVTQSLNKLKQITTVQFQKEVTQNLNKTQLLLLQIQQKLVNEGLTLYQNQVFPTQELMWHLKNGHLLIKSKNWILAQQLCHYCNQTGNIRCTNIQCQNGKISILCNNGCNQGRILCPICQGKGLKNCKTCNNQGYFQKNCSHCNGAGGKRKIVVSQPSPMIIHHRNGSVYRPAGPGFAQEYWAECEYCNATGVVQSPCKTCNGRGGIECPETIPCPQCDGKGLKTQDCPICLGKNQISCPNCHGIGFTGQPILYPGSSTPQNIEKN